MHCKTIRTESFLSPSKLKTTSRTSSKLQVKDTVRIDPNPTDVRWVDHYKCSKKAENTFCRSEQSEPMELSESGTSLEIQSYLLIYEK